MGDEANSTNHCKESIPEHDCSEHVAQGKVYNILCQPICPEPWMDKSDPVTRSPRYNLLGQPIRNFTEAELARHKSCSTQTNYSILGQTLLDEKWQPLPDDPSCPQKTYNVIGQAITRIDK